MGRIFLINSFILYTFDSILQIVFLFSIFSPLRYNTDYCFHLYMNYTRNVSGIFQSSPKVMLLRTRNQGFLKTSIPLNQHLFIGIAMLIHVLWSAIYIFVHPGNDAMYDFKIFKYMLVS